MAVQLNLVKWGSSCLEGSRFYPPHKKKTEESIQKIVSDLIGANCQKISIQLRPGDPTLILDGKEISLSKTPALKSVQRAVRYYQNVGVLDRRLATKEEGVLAEEWTKKTVNLVRSASIPGTNGNILAGMRLADDSLSLTRNVMFALPVFGPKNDIASHLGYYAGLFWSFFALRELDDGFIEFKRAKVIGDSEGKDRAKARIFSGSIVSLASLSYLAGKVCDSFVSTNIAAPILGASNIFFGVGSLLAAGTSALGVMRCNYFNNRLNEYLDNPGLTEKQKMCGAVQFLKDSISVTAEERSDLEAQINKKCPNLTIEQKAKLLHRKLSDLTEVKVKYMKRRTSNESLRLILDQANSILEKLGKPSLESEGIRDAALLIDKIQRASRTKKTLFALGLVASVISFVATVILNIVSLNAVPFILYGISGTIYLAMTIYMLAGMLKKRNV